jgi:hypothetical protein
MGPTTPPYTSLGVRGGAVGVDVRVRLLVLEGLAARAGAPLGDTAEQ